MFQHLYLTASFYEEHLPKYLSLEKRSDTSQGLISSLVSLHTKYPTPRPFTTIFSRTIVVQRFLIKIHSLQMKNTTELSTSQVVRCYRHRRSQSDPMLLTPTEQRAQGVLEREDDSSSAGSVWEDMPVDLRSFSSSMKKGHHPCPPMRQSASLVCLSSYFQDAQGGRRSLNFVARDDCDGRCTSLEGQRLSEIATIQS